MKLRPRSATIVAVCIFLLAAACTAEGAEVTSIVKPPTSSSTAALAETNDSASPPDQGADKSAQRLALDRVVGWMNGTPLVEAEYSANFAPPFAAQAPYEAIRDLFSNLAGAGPWSIEQLRSESEFGLEADVVRDTGESLVVALGVDSSEPTQIALLLFQPESIANFEPSETQAEAEQRLAEAGLFRFLVSDVSDGSCQTITESSADEAAPLGSVFKLYVLGAVLDAVADGTVDWVDPVEIRDELDSLPSGRTQDEIAGSELTVLELATRMIQISDNTATDHLIALVGREAVETAFATYGHSQPQLNVPTLTTREVFVLKLVFDDADRERYIEADEAGRRLILENEVAVTDLPTLASAASWTAPIAINQIEWFASAQDVCRVLVALSGDETVREILSDQTYSGPWTYVGNKGGSEPGVLAQSWLVDLDGEQSSVVVALVSNSRADLRADTQLLLLELRDLALTS